MMTQYEADKVRRVAVIGAPLCDGERELGVEKAPRVIREAGLTKALSGRAFRET